MSTDRRVKYTKAALKASLLQLLQEKPISRITVKAICETADINRATFYAHYTDQFDHLHQIELEFIDGINRYLDGLSASGERKTTVERMFVYIYENRALCRTLLSPNGDIGFEEKVEQIVRDRVCASWQTEPPAADSLLDYTYTYIVTGSVGIVKKWITDEPARYSAQEIADYVLRIVSEGLGVLSDQLAANGRA